MRMKTTLHTGKGHGATTQLSGNLLSFPIKPFFSKRKLRLTFGLFLFTVIGFAQSIFTNPITGTNPNTSNPYTAGQVVNPNITVSGIGRGNGISASNGNNVYNATGFATSGTFSAGNNDYFEWTITPATGYRIDFTSFVYTGTNGFGPQSFIFRSSADSFAANIGSPNANGTTISLTAAAFQNRQTAITFRFYGYNASFSAGTYSINDFTFNGTVSCIQSITAQPASQNICAGNPLNLSVTVSGSNTYQWKNGGVIIPGATSSTYSIPSVTTGDAGNYTVEVTNLCGVTVSNTAIIGVFDNLAASVSITANPPDTEICSSTSVTFTATAVNGGTASYQWKVNDVNAGTNSPTFVPTSLPSTAVVKCVLTSSTPCLTGLPATSNEITLTVSQAPTVSAGPDQIICVTSPNVTMAGSMGGAATEITWSGGEGSFEPDKSTLNATYIPSDTELLGGPVVLTITTNDPDGLCTEATDDVTITFSLPPTADAGADQGICADAVTVSIVGTRGGPGVTGSTWTTSGTGTFANAANLSTTYTPSAADKTAGSVTLKITTNDPPGTCVAAFDTMLVTIAPVATANAGVDQTVCSAAPAVTLAGVVGGSATSGTWSGGAGTFTPSNTALNAVYTPTAGEIAAGPGTKVTLTLTTDDPSGACNAKTDQMQITINQAAVANAGVDQTICSGSTVSLVGTRSGNPAPNSSTWSTSGTGSFSSTSNLSSTYTPSAADRAAGTVTITLTTSDPSGPCGSNADSMIVTINQVPTATAGPNQSVCAGSSITLAGTRGGTATSSTWTAPSGSFSDATSLTSTYTPSVASGAVILTLTTNDPAGPCTAASSTLTVTVNPTPAAVVIAPASTTVCEGTITALTASGGSVPGFVIKNESFDGTVSFVSSISAPTTNPWAKQADGFNPGVAFHSPSNTAFEISYIGIGTSGTANTQLTSPVINTTGYSALVLAFDHTFFLSGATGTGKVEVSTDGGTTWPTTLVTYSANQGDQDSWLSVTLPMNAFINQTNLKIRFNFVSSAGFLNYSWWAIDSFSLTGTKASVTWAPSGGLFTDAGATVPYGGGVTGTVYAKSLSTQTYTATSTSTFNCTKSDSVTLTVNPTPTLSGVAQAATICQDAAATINLSGLLPLSTSTVSYKIGAGAVVPVPNVTADASGNASFTVTLALAQNGETLMVTNVQRTDNSPPACNLAFASATPANSVVLQVNANVTYYADVDGDLFGNPSAPQVSCFGAPPGYVTDNTDCNDNQLQYLDNDGDTFGSTTLVACGVPNNTDCNDNQLQYQDSDGDGFGTTTLVACGALNNTDCNDNQLQYLDNDGDLFGSTTLAGCGVTNHTDCNDNQLQYVDADGDGFGADILVACGVTNNTDCDDADNTKHTTFSFYTDSDIDGYGAGILTSVCAVNASTPPSGFSLNNTDCDDTKSTVHPGAVEIGYNLTDDDCDGLTDEGFPPKVTTIIGCNFTLSAIDSYIYANLVGGAQGYRWRVTTMSGPSINTVQFIDTALRAVKLTQLASYAFNTVYKVEVAVYYAGFLQPFTTSNCTVSTPATTTSLINCEAGTLLTTMTDVIYAENIPFATGYRFNISDPTNPLTNQVLDRPLREFRMNLITAFQPKYGKTYNVQVALRNTDGSYLPYGPTCSVTTPIFPTTSIQDIQCDNGFGAPYAVPSNSTTIYANSYPGAIAYVFKLVGPGAPSGVEVVKVLRAFKISDFAGMGIVPGATYNVSVRMIFNYSDLAGPYGKVCTLIAPAIAREDITKVFNVLAHPNPFSESFSIDIVTSAPENVTVKIYDMTGRTLEVQTIPLVKINTLKIGERYPSGVYSVIVSQGDNIRTLRLIKR